MTKMLDGLLQDALTRLKSPEVRETLEQTSLRPIISSVLDMLYPYLLGVMLLWVIMFVCVALILLILVRGTLAGVPMIVLGK
jgi:hypothetical protein